MNADFTCSTCGEKWSKPHCPKCAEDESLLAAPQGSADYVRCKVSCEWLDGGVTLRYSESRDWSSEEDALSYAAGCYRSGKYLSIRVIYSRKYNGRWRNSGSKPYPPNSNISGANNMKTNPKDSNRKVEL